MLVKISEEQLKAKVAGISLVLTDCDGVLTDGCVYYTASGEAMKRFSFRDGMGVERLRKLFNIDTGIITGENSEIVRRRAEKLNITEYYPGIKDKYAVLREICEKRTIKPEAVAYIGDDVNDTEVMKKVGLSACPIDAMSEVKDIADIVLTTKGGEGAFREFAEIIIKLKNKGL